MTTYCLLVGTDQDILGFTILIPNHLRKDDLWFNFEVKQEVEATDWWDAVETIFDVTIHDAYTDGDDLQWYLAMSTMLPCNVKTYDISEVEDKL